MKEQLSISVIIPTYNRADLLMAALESIFAQTRQPSEIIVIDDGSTDRTFEVVACLGSQVRYFRQENTGVASARNLGLQKASGEIVCWLDSDDLWEPNFLMSMVSELEKRPGLDGLYCGFYYIDGDGNRLRSVSRVVPDEELADLLVESNFIVTPGLVVRKSCYDAVGLFDTNLTIGEDADMWWRLARRFNITGIATHLVSIRIHDQNSLGNSSTFIESILKLTEKHYGKDRGALSEWTDDKRHAYAFAYRTAAFRAVEADNPDLGWQYLARAVSIMPILLARVDTFYELALGNQPRGYRGQSGLGGINTRGSEIIDRLDRLFEGSSTEVAALGDTAYANAYLALAMLSDQAGDWRWARTYMREALMHNRKLLKDPLFTRRLIKLHLGKPIVNLLVQLKTDNPKETSS